MTDPIKDQALRAYNKLKIWVEASRGTTRHTLSETEAVYDDQKGQVSCNLLAPINTNLTICLSVGAKKPIRDNFAFEISMEGRPIHTVFLKDGNHSKARISHFFGMKGTTLSKYGFFLGAITECADMPASQSTRFLELGIIQIKVFTLPALTERGVSALSYLPEIVANVADIGPNSLCIRSRKAVPCDASERKTNWRPPTPVYRLAGQEPVLTCTYKCRRSEDSVFANSSFGGGWTLGLQGSDDHCQEDIQILKGQVAESKKNQEAPERKRARDKARLDNLEAHAKRNGYRPPPGGGKQGGGSGGGGSSGRSGAGSASSASRPDRPGSTLNEI